MTRALQVVWLSSIDDVEASAWNALRVDNYPFTQHACLAAMEHSGAVSAESGWQPQHLLLKRGADVIAALPLYLKSHSYGEYVFDWAWADAWQRSGFSYYPKLLAAIPFTPATGPRLLVASGENNEAIVATVLAAIKQRLGAEDLSTFHLLFPDNTLREQCRDAGLLERVGAQYHWFNRGFKTFDDFLATFNSRKRKNLRKERERVAEQGLTLRVLEGSEITPHDWRRFHHFYQLTYAKRSGHGGYLGREFFAEIGRTLSDQIVLVLAEVGGETAGNETIGREVIAGALNFKDDTTLYGRYWGCSREFEFLHFETCYYQGIDYCIQHNLQRFDPGAQGEHKIQRGFEPTLTYSCHWIEHVGLRRAVADFLQREHQQIENYIVDARKLLPFKCNENSVN